MAGNGCLSCALLCTASTLLPRMRGARWWTRQADPFTPAFTENSKFAALFGRPIQDSRVVGYERWSRPQRVRNFLSVRYRQVLSRALSVRCERSKKDKVQLPSFRTSGGILAIQLPVQRCPSVNATSRNFSGLRDPVSEARSSRQTGSRKSGSCSWNTHRTARSVPAACYLSSQTKRTDRSCHHASSGVPACSRDWRIG